MRAKSMVLILIALGCGLVASIAISQVLERGSGSGEAKVETVQIYVATADIDMNEQLTASCVRVEDWPKTKIPEGSIIDMENILDRFARTRLYEGEPILMRKLMDEISGPAITIPVGHRVCSLKVQMDTAVSGLLNPGDRVDIIGYFRASQDVPTTGTREILRNVRVFAVNSETEKETDTDGQTIVAKTVSVLVKQDQVARLMLATELGTLRLALRHPNEEPEDENLNETATIETLFGLQSESADEEGTVPGQASEPAGGFLKFLAGLSGPGPAVEPEPEFPVSMPMAEVAPVGPVWKMTILSPDGGQQFQWSDENSLPTMDYGQPSGGLPANDIEPPASLDGQPAVELTPNQDEPQQEEEEVQQEEEQEEDLGYGDD